MSDELVITRDYPQADKLDKVIKTVKTVAQGSSTYQDIARHFGFTNRQGGYYRFATEQLGLTTRLGKKNFSQLTNLGEQFVSSPNKQHEILVNQIFKMSVFQNLLGMLASSKTFTPRAALVDAIIAIDGMTLSMADRRLATMLGWLKTLGMIEKKGANIRLEKILPQDSSIEISDLTIPVIPNPGELRAFKEVPNRVKEAGKTIQYEVDAAKLERANSAHERLRVLLSRKIAKSGITATCNRFIDLAARIDGNDYIIEVKTTGQSLHDQIRRGVSQLYEYRYLQRLPDARLVLCIEKEPMGSDKWLLDYVVKDRRIFVVWDDRDDLLFTTPDLEGNIPFVD